MDGCAYVQHRTDNGERRTLFFFLLTFLSEGAGDADAEAARPDL
jgi:hypothetical protein